MKLSKRNIITIVQWEFVAATLIIMIYRNVHWIFYVGLIVGVIIIVKRSNKDENEEVSIETLCDPKKYLKEIERSRVKKNVTVYSIQRTYGLIHDNKLEEAKEVFANYDFYEEEVPNKFYNIHIMNSTRLLFEEKNLEGLIALQIEVKDSKNSNDSIVEYLKAYRSILEDTKLEAIEKLVISIPKQPHRLEIYELEYQLVKLYLEVENYADCAAVANFISKKNFKVHYTALCRELGIEAKKHIVNE